MKTKEIKRLNKAGSFRQQNGGIPEGWEEMPLSDAIEINPSRLLKKGTITKYVSMADLKEYSKRIQRYVERQYSGGSRFQNNDTLMARITPCLENGKTAFVDVLEDKEIAAGSTEFMVLSAKAGRTIDQFVYYLAVSPEVREMAIQSMTGTSGRQRVEADVFDKIIIGLPNIPEQRTIAKILADLDVKIELNRRMNETLEHIARAIFKQWFVDFEFPGHEKTKFMDGLPEGWRLGTLGEIADNPRRGIDPERIVMSTPYIGLEHMPRRCTSLSDWGCADDLESNKFAFRRGEILFGKLRPYFHKVGIAPIDGVCSTDILVVVPEDPEWFGLVFSQVISDDFINYATATSTGTKMPRTNWQDITRYEIALPSKKIAADFTAEVQPLINKIVANIYEARVLSNIRDALLPKLMSGEVRVR